MQNGAGAAAHFSSGARKTPAYGAGLGRRGGVLRSGHGGHQAQQFGQNPRERFHGRTCWYWMIAACGLLGKVTGRPASINSLPLISWMVAVSKSVKR